MARPAKPWYRAAKDTWYATIQGNMVSLGVKGEGNRKEAEQAWHRKAAEAEALPKPEQKPTPAVQPILTPTPTATATVKEVIDGFIADVEGRGRKPNTLRCYRDFLLPFAEANAHAPASSVKPFQAEAYSRKPTWGNDSRKTFLTVLVSAFKWAERAGMIDRNPLIGVKKPQGTSRGEKALLTAEEHAQLVKHATPAFGLFLTVLYAVGCRPGEAAAITAENFDPDAGQVRLSEHKTAEKTGRSRVLYLTPEAVALLLKQREKHPTGHLLRNTQGRAWGCTTLVKAMEAARKRAGIPHAISYGLRHTFATDALAAGVPDAQVAELLGHQGTNMLHRHYSHLGKKAEVLRNALGQVRGKGKEAV